MGPTGWSSARSRGGDATDEFLAALGQALGLTLRSGSLDIGGTFTDLGPP